MKKIIDKIITGMPTSDGAGVNLTRVIGQPQLKNLDPFLMLDEIRSDQPNDYLAGFPAHPHKGFETLTYLMHGSMEHQDSTGGKGLINSGGVQYMTAGRGIIHSEIPKQDDGLLWGFQLWLNLPAADKLAPPSYVDIPVSEIPVISVDDAKIKLIAGEVSQSSLVGPVKRPDLDLQIYDISSEQDATVNLSLSNAHRGFVYVYQGQLQINGRPIQTSHLCTLGEGENIEVNLLGKAGCLFVAGLPIGEPIVQYGPFVMNTMAEIEQAIDEYQSGTLVKE